VSGLDDWTTGRLRSLRNQALNATRRAWQVHSGVVHTASQNVADAAAILWGFPEPNETEARDVHCDLWGFLENATTQQTESTFVRQRAMADSGERLGPRVSRGSRSARSMSIHTPS
jgi:hypothetical protein